MHTGQGEVFKSPSPPPAPDQRGRFNPTGLGEQVLKRGRAGRGRLHRLQPGQPCALTLLAGFLAALAETPEPCLGDCWALALRHDFETERLATWKPNEGW